MSAHTPGPWTADHEIEGWMSGTQRGCMVSFVSRVVSSGEEGLIGIVTEHSPIANCLSRDTGETAAIANARLIAAAPELLAALHHMEVCASCAQADWMACPGGQRALAAIAKAEGRS